MSSQVAPALWNNSNIQLSLLCRFASWIIDVLYIMSSFYFCSVWGLHRASAGWQVFSLRFTVASLRLCVLFVFSGRCVLRLPRIVLMFNSCRSSCINQAVFVRLTLPLSSFLRLPGAEAAAGNASRQVSLIRHLPPTKQLVRIYSRPSCRSQLASKSTRCFPQFMAYLCSFKVRVVPQSCTKQANFALVWPEVVLRERELFVFFRFDSFYVSW